MRNSKHPARQRSEPSGRRYHTNFAVNEDQGDGQEEEDESDVDAVYEEQDEEILYTGPPETSEAEDGEESEDVTVHVSAG